MANYEVNALLYGSSMAAYNQATIEAALAAIGTTNKVTLLLRPGTWAISSNADWSAYTNVTFKIVPGAVFSGAFTLTLPPNNINAGLYQIFASNVVVAGLRYAEAEWFGITPKASTPAAAGDSVAMAQAIASLAAYGKLHFNDGIYWGWLIYKKDNITVSGNGPDSTVIKLPDSASYTVTDESGNPQTGVPLVVDFGEFSRGNNATAYSGNGLYDLSIDGNFSGTTEPALDIFGVGVGLTKNSKANVKNVRVYNTWLSGISVVINSNYAQVDAYIESCGNLSVPGSLQEHAFAVNSSKYGIYNIVTNLGHYGAVMQDNVFESILNIAVYDPVTTGVVLANQVTNQSHGNIINAAVYDAGTGQAMSIGANFNANKISLTSFSASDTALYITNYAADPTLNARNNIIDLVTRESGGAGLICYGHGNQVRHNSFMDGQTGTVGTSFVSYIYGDQNTIDFTMFDSSVNPLDGAAVAQARGITFIAGATDNVLRHINFNTSVQIISDLGTRTKIHTGGTGANISSAATISIPDFGDTFTVTGTADITAINVSFKRTVTLIFSGTAATNGVVDGSNLKISGNFAYTPDDVMVLYCDGTNWIEKSRSVN